LFAVIRSIAARSLSPEHTVAEAPDGQSAQAFLTSTDHIFIDMEFTVPDLAAILGGTKTLYFVGYVDYIDAFKGRHRGGYARVYNRNEKTNNLVFVTSSLQLRHLAPRECWTRLGRGLRLKLGWPCA
jgi:hypothetical protein